MHNPFAEKNSENDRDDEAIALSLTGNSGALETLILRHQSWIFNIALAMTGNLHQAEDVTQEVLIKVVTRLSTYQPQKAAFRTWLYRIVANSVLNLKENKKELFFARMLANGEDKAFLDNQPDPRTAAADSLRMNEETKCHCILCMLLCLSRRERMVFTLAGIFDVTDKIGAEICDMSRANFRQLFLRSRRKLHDYFSRNCSLLNERNPCICAAQTGRLMQAGVMVPGRFISGQHSPGTIRGMLGNAISRVEDSYREFLSLFRDQPFLQGPDMVLWLRDLLKSRPVLGLLDLAPSKPLPGGSICSTRNSPRRAVCTAGSAESTRRQSRTIRH
jgi:RNA polymerase sigma factor (sigma-70 family)